MPVSLTSFDFERHNNDLARQHDKELYVVAGGEYSASPATINDAGKIQIPEYTWKIAVVMEAGQGLADVTSPDDLQVLAVRMPNLNETAQRNAPWTDFTTTVRSIEERTGYVFLTALSDSIQAIVKTGTQAPVARLSGPTSAVVGQEVYFDASSSSDPDGDAITFVWSFSDGGGATGPTTNHTFSSAGTHQVYVRVTDTHGAFGSTTLAVEVLSLAEATQSLAAMVDALVADGSLTAGEGNALNVTLAGAAAQYEAGNTVAGNRRISAFIEQVEGLVRGRRLPSASGDLLIAQARVILEGAGG